MHELYLAESVLNIVREYANKQAVGKVNSIALSFGRLSCIEPRSLQFAFKVQAQGTPAQDAELQFKILPAVIHCFACGSNWEVDMYEGICPRCKAEEVMLVGGTEELQLLEMDVD
ncbi:MAG TPA: hydrogenase maturation nickel metallochaperone HypA [Smithellaceae bacterium]|nr:hydrogenase maturation nickel metallochaperone HypA [Smithellaceae bacterium]